MLKYYKHILFVCIVFVFGSCANNQSRFINNTAVFVPDQELAIDEVLKSNQFTNSNKYFHDYGYFHSDVWFKFPIEITQDKKYTLELYQHFLEEVQFYIVKKNIILHKSQSTGTKYFKQGNYAKISSINTHQYQFHVPKGSYTGYLKIHSTYSPIRGAIRYWSDGTITPKKYFTQKQSFWNFAFGFTVFAVFIALVFYSFTKEIIYVFYALYMLIAIANMYITRGFTQDILPALSFLRYDLRSYFNTVYILVNLGYFYFLIPKNYRAKWTSIGIKITATYIILVTLFGFFLPQSISNWHIIIIGLKPAMFVTIFICFIHLLQGYKRGYKMALVYLIAYSLLFVTIGFHLLQITKMIKWSIDVALFIWELSLFAELLIFTIAFAYQYHQTQQQKLALSKRVYQDQQAFLKRYQMAQEKERIKISKELHDGVVQQIGSVILQIRNKSKALNPQHTNMVLTRLEDVNQYLRNLSHTMIPKALTQLGLQDALKDLLHQTLANTNIKYEVDFFNLSKRLSENVEHNLFRISQELIQNIIKHSKATEVSFILIKNTDNLVLKVEDNGIGFDTEVLKKGIGLDNIKQRITILKGDFYIHSEEKNGTEITIKIPLV